MASTVNFNLPENLTIAHIHGLHEEFEALVDKQDCDVVVLKASSVQRADTAGLQLLLAFMQATRERQISVTWDHPSQTLCNAAKLLGVDVAIGIH
ncbi:STAS domain-containing protein [Teredinibacter haidensis]|uniref:STAS domain-containing protein n=1 Tax=Teredinibacter haidensis TaxID=2731755 RepID=UPI0009489C82|nr:STAS domain-containing protein [Teredinibacter haidensis]